MTINFLGVKMQQSEEEFRYWEGFLGENKFDRVIELGTGFGAFAIYLSLYCLKNDISFYTFEKDEGRIDDFCKRVLEDHEGFIQGDIFEDHQQFIKVSVQMAGRTLLFCDNGCKVKELKVFSPSMKVGDVIGFHDFGVEIMQEDIDESPLDLVQIGGCESLRFFEKVT